MHQHQIRLGADLEADRLQHHEARVRLVVRRLEERVSEKRDRGEPVPVALHASLADFRSELARLQDRLAATG